MTTKKRGFLLSVLILWIGFLSMGVSDAQVVIIPRDGFPYCEPFTNSSTRANTVFDGIPDKALLTGGATDPIGSGVLQLTADDYDQRGWVYVDLPFSSAYGIKASFEYFAYGSSPITEKADGFSFFLFDGTIDASTFVIGGRGGSLGYSPLRYSTDNTFLGGYGLNGGYMGIGLDSRGNWGNQYEGKYGGFAAIPPAPFAYGSGLAAASFPKYSNSIAIRGPVDSSDSVRDNGMTGMGVGAPSVFPQPAPGYRSYPFIDGKILFNDPTDGGAFAGLNPSFFLPPNQRFTVASASNSRVTDCAVDGYRKVFIDLKPNGAGAFTVSMSMLVTINGGNQQVVPIFTNVPYPFAAPQNLKVGFAASTGGFKNRHEIRNVTVEVSSIDPALAPNPANLSERVCFNENLTFDFNVSLPAQNQFVRCLQLFPTNPGPPNNAPNPNGDAAVGNCGLSGVCVEKCKPENKTITVPGVGIFESILEDLTDQNFGTERSQAKIKFTPEPGFFGTHTIYYTVIDNYGLTSEARTVTVTVNPVPKIDSSGSIIGPTCNGQNDGTISNVILKDLIPGYTFSWADAAGNVLPQSSYSKSETIVGNYIQATVGVTGVNLGKYYLTVNNPATNSACADTFEFEVKDVRGTPVDVVLDDQEVCEGTPVVFTPQLEDPTDANNPTFLWWKDNNKTQPVTHNLIESGVTYQLSAPGVLTITGLPQRANPYVYYVEVKADASQNLCATPAGSLKKVEVLVLPPLVLNAVVTDDLCLDGIGEITVNAVGGFGVYTFSLDGGAPQASNKFAGLSPGIYSIDVTAGTNCIGTISKEVLGAPELFLVEDKFFNPACGVPNGLVEISFSGGTPAYKLELFKNGVLEKSSATPSSPTVYQDLAPGTYQVKITDANGCIRTLDRVLINDVGIPITVTPMVDELCEGNTASIIPVVNTLGNASLKWFKDLAATQEVLSNATPDGNGHTFAINSSTMELQVGGLKAGSYSYYLVATGPGYCPNPPFVANVVVSKPITATITSTDEVCLNAKDGSITVNATGADGNFEYSLDGGAFVAANVFTGLAPGNHKIDIRSTGANGCTFQTNATILAPNGPISINKPDVIRSSCDLNNGWIENLTISGGWGNYQVEWRKGSLNGTVIPGSITGIKDLLPDTYYLIVKDEKGCTVNFNFLVEEMPDPVFVVAPLELCAGEKVDLIPVNTISGSADSEIKWFKDAALSQQISTGNDSGNPAISYSIDTDGKLSIVGLPGSETIYTYFMQSVCTGAVVDAKVMVRIVPNLQFETDPEICFGAADGKIRIVSGSVSTFDYSVDGGAKMTQAQLEALSFAPKDYSIAVTNAGLCVQNFQVKVLGPPAAITRVSFNEIRSSCNLSNGRIENVVIAGGWGGYSVEWRKGSVSGALIPGDIAGAMDLGPDAYFLTVTDKEGCSATFDFTITEQPQPLFSVNTVENCAGEVVVFTPVNTVSGSSPTTLNWYKDAGKTKQIQNGPDALDPTVSYSINASTGQLSVSGLKGNTMPYSFFLHATCSDQLVEAKSLVRVVPIPAFSTDPVTCFGGKDGKIIVGAGGDAKYLYSIDGANPITEAQLEAMSFAAKVYTIRVSNEGFCLTDFSVAVIQPNAPLQVTNLSKFDPICGANIGIIQTKITGGWSPYKVDVFKDGILNSSSSVPGPDFEKKDLAPGVYSLTITDAEGCQVTSATATLVFVPTQIDAIDTEICEGEDAVFVPTATPVPTGATFKWFKDSNLTIPIVSSATPDAGGRVFQISANGTLTISGLDYLDSSASYFVAISGGTSCPGNKKEVKAKINRIAVLKFSVQDEACFGEKGTITLQGSAGDGVFKYSLDGKNFQASNSFIVAPGSYTGFVQSGNSCIVSVPNIVVKGPTSSLTVSAPIKNDATCNSKDGKLSFDVAGGYGNYTIVIKRNNQLLSTIPFAGGTFTLSNLASGSYNIEVQDSGGCVRTIPGQIELEDIPTPLAVVDDVICEGETAMIDASTTQVGITPTYTWYQNSNGTGPITSGTLNGVTYQIGAGGSLSISGLKGRSTPYTYYVKISGTGVCEPDLMPANVQVFAIPNLRVSNPSIVCDPKGYVDLTLFIEGFNPSVYDYQIVNPSGAVMRLEDIESVVQSGSYLVKSSSKGANCWTPNQRIQVLIASEELISNFEYQADIGGGNFISNSDAHILELVNFQDVSLGNVIIWNWDFGDGATSSQENPTHIYQKKGVYTVTLTTIDSIGCISEIQKVITVLDDYVIIIPNAFTPDGVKNQNFKPEFRGVAGLEFYIFNTWGELIYHSSGLETIGWDGTHKGQLVQNGNYVYRAVFETRSGEKVEKSGVFVLIR